MAYKIVLVIFLIHFVNVNCYNEIQKHNTAINYTYIEEAIDAEQCDRQVKALMSNTMLLFQFLDAGLRTPRGILTGNAVDLGNYHQCLGIDQQVADMHIQGKYCSILVPYRQNLTLPAPYIHNMHFDPTSLRMDDETASKIGEYNLRRRQMLALSGDFDGFDDEPRSGNPLANMVFRLGVCVPKPCTTQQAITSLIFNITEIGFQYTEHYCRLSGDKPFVPADYVAIAIFSLLGFLTLVSTSYDLSYRFIFKKDVKQMSVLCRSFSVYSNGKILTTFSNSPGNLRCLDGIRTLAMIWVILGHSFSTEPFIANPVDSNMWMFSANALWLTAATMTVDTFFTMGGVLLVYTTAAKMNQVTFLKNLHWFYLNRFMRVTPMLAIAVLLQATYYNHMTDGPFWVTVADRTDRCRNYWLNTLLHVQNLINPRTLCVAHSWYVAIDFQLYFISPLVLIWVFSGKKHIAWMGLLGGLTAVIIGSTIYNFHLNLQAGTLVPSRFPEIMDFLSMYYFNTLTRGSPFFVGLIFGYVLHIYRKKEMRIPVIVVIILWSCFAGILGGIFYFKYVIKQFDWDNQLVDNLMNSFMRPTYAFGICWLIVACVHGYAGPINWLLSLDLWRFPARLTYGMYLYHFPLMISINASAIAPIYFSVENFAFKFLSHLVLAVIYSYFFTLLIDTPISVLFKQLMDSVKKSKPPGKPNKIENEDNGGKSIAFTDDAKASKDIDADIKEVQSVPNDNIIVSKSLPIEGGSSDVNAEPKVVRIDDTGIHVQSSNVSETK